jgi:dihydrofolate reductase
LSGKTQYFTSSTLDGFLADPDHSLDWLFQFEQSEFDGFDAFISEVGALAMGSHTCEWMLEHLIGPEADHPQPWPYRQPTWVFTSRTLPEVPGVEIVFVEGDVTDPHSEMMYAAAGKNVWIVGGGELAGRFHDAGLLDEIIVGIASVTLGAGFPLFPRRVVSPPLRLVSASSTGPGFAVLRYEVPRR